ncbi:hypothetical protein EDB83DRAFT_1537191 [Lactarius deliciosus]|nr:hypothetical protein EDB83DRAFT_1537191 [Lactarius deliciosus]
MCTTAWLIISRSINSPLALLVFPTTCDSLDVIRICHFESQGVHISTFPEKRGDARTGSAEPPTHLSTRIHTVAPFGRRGLCTRQSMLSAPPSIPRPRQ